MGASEFPISKVWTRKQINLGFAETGEEVSFNGEQVTLSTGSQDDTITRSRSSIISWGVATGYFVPSKFAVTSSEPSQVKFHDYLMGSKSSDGFFNTDLVYEQNNSVVARPLSYNQLVKSIKSLRENGQEAQRNASLQWETVIKNRRLAIAFALNQSALLGKPLVFERFVDYLSGLDDFVINRHDFKATMVSELGNAFVIGTPFKLVSPELLQGLRVVDLNVLSTGADLEIADKLQNMVTESSLFGQ